jgi:hypothetical protein
MGMDDYLEFEGRVEPVRLGKALHRMIRVPDHIQAALGAKRVEVEINAHSTNLALRRTPGSDGWCVWAGQSLLDRIGIAPGAPLKIRLRKAPEDYVEVPGDVADAIRAAGLRARWDSLTPGKRRGLLYGVNSAKRAATRASRIAKLVERLPI